MPLDFTWDGRAIRWKRYARGVVYAPAATPDDDRQFQRLARSVPATVIVARTVAEWQQALPADPLASVTAIGAGTVVSPALLSDARRIPAVDAFHAAAVLVPGGAVAVQGRASPAVVQATMFLVSIAPEVRTRAPGSKLKTLLTVVAVLAVLVVRTQSEPQTLQGHLGRMTVLAQLGAADAEADTQVARARLSLEAEPTGLADAIGRLESARAGLAVHRDGLRAVSRDVGSAVSELLRQIAEKQTLLASYRSRLSEFATSYAALRQQAEALLVDPALPNESPLRGTVRRLIEEVTAYSLQSVPTNQADIESLLTALTADRGASAALRSRLLSLGSAAARVLGDKDQVLLVGPIAPATQRRLPSLSPISATYRQLPLPHGADASASQSSTRAPALDAPIP